MVALRNALPVLLAILVSGSNSQVATSCEFNPKCFCNGTQVYCVGLGLTEVPSGVPENTTSLILDNNCIYKSLSLMYFPNLTLLSVVNNHLLTFEENLFENLTASDSLLVNFTKNYLNEQEFRVNCGSSETLFSFDLSGNLLTSIPQFINCSIDSLWLGNNRGLKSASLLNKFNSSTLNNLYLLNTAVSHVGQNDFLCWTSKLQTQLVICNQLALVDQFALAPIASYLVVLDLSNNQLLDLSSLHHVVNDLENGEAPNLSKLRLANLPGIKSPTSNLFANLSGTSLLELDVSFNPSWPFNEAAFYSGVLKVANLTLRNNSLQNQFLNVFPGQNFSQLQILDLSNNQISDSNTLFQVLRLPSLYQLFVAGNRISTVSNLTFQSFVNFVGNSEFPLRLDMSSNPFNCDDQLLWFADWIRQADSSSALELINVEYWQCSSPPSCFGLKLFNFFNATACPVPPVTPHSGNSLTIILCSAFAFLLLLLVVVIALLRYRRRHRYNDYSEISGNDSL